MKWLIKLGNRYAEKSDWTDFALTKFCLCAMGVLIGLFVPKKKAGLAAYLAGSVFGVTYTILMKKVAETAKELGKK